MNITFDPAKRAKNIEERGLDYADAAKVFDGLTATVPDDRRDYGEPRFITAGFLDDRLVVLAWTPRDDGRRVFSMRYAHEREEDLWRKRMG